MQRLLSLLVALLVAALAPAAAEAAPVVLYDGTNVTGISSFEFAGGLYNLTFATGSFDQVYTDRGLAPFTVPDVLVGGVKWAAGAAGAIADILDRELVRPPALGLSWLDPGDLAGLMISGPRFLDPDGVGCYYFYVPGSVAYYYDPSDPGTMGDWRVVETPGSSSASIRFDDKGFVLIEPVPEPASLLLLGTGLVGLARLRRRRG